MCIRDRCYNVADTLIVGRFLGPDALAAVGSSFTLMTFLTSILLGLCMGSGAVFSIRFGRRDECGLKEAVFASFVLIAAVAAVLNVLALSLIHIFCHTAAWHHQLCAAGQRRRPHGAWLVHLWRDPV